MKQFTRKKLSNQSHRKNPKLKMMADRIRALLSRIEEVGAAYEEMDNLMEYAIENSVDLTAYGISLKDKFEGKNKFKAWKSTPFTRYEFITMPAWSIHNGKNQAVTQKPTHRHEVKQAPKQHSFKFPVRRSR